MRVYVSGPMRGYKQFNFPLFDEVAMQLKKAGFEVANPAEHDRQAYPDIETWEGFETGDTTKCPKFILPESLAWDFQAIIHSDGIVMLPGWEKSQGAKAERFVAECIGRQVFLYAAQPDGKLGLVLDPRTKMKYPELSYEYDSLLTRYNGVV